MISLTVLFYIFVGLFALVGALRGFAKEVMVTASGILAIFIIEAVMPKVISDFTGEKALNIELGVLIVCAFLGYQTSSIRQFSETGRFQRATFRDGVLGAVIGGLNGYVLFGSIWYFIAKAGYPYPWLTAPDPASEAGAKAALILERALPTVLEGPSLYVAMAVVFLVVIGVFI